MLLATFPLLQSVLGSMVLLLRRAAWKRLHVGVRGDAEDAKLGKLLRAQHTLVGHQRRSLRRVRVLRLGRLMRTNHLLIRQDVLHDQVLILFSNRLVQLLLVVGDQLLNVDIVSLRGRHPLTSIYLLGIGCLGMLLLFQMTSIELCRVDLVTAIRLTVRRLVHDGQVARACHLVCHGRVLPGLQLERLRQSLHT